MPMLNRLAEWVAEVYADDSAAATLATAPIGAHDTMTDPVSVPRAGTR